MKSIDKYLAAIAILAFSSFCFSAQADDLKIGVVNTTQIIQQSPQGRQVLQELKKDFSSRQQKLISEKKSLNKMQQKMKKSSAIMSQAEMEHLQDKIRQAQHDLKRDQQSFQEDLQYERKEKVTNIKKVILKAVRTVAKQDGYDLVLDQSVSFASKHVNITDKVIQYLKKKAG